MEEYLNALQKAELEVNEYLKTRKVEFEEWSICLLDWQKSNKIPIKLWIQEMIKLSSSNILNR
jgi:hypothetical protein